MAATDRDALVALFNATDGRNWLDCTNWSTGKDLSRWHGIKVHQGRVVKIELTSNNLRGSIPKELGSLSELEELYLDHNHLIRGSIPKELGGLSKLEKLFLSNNKLTGPIPEALGALSKLGVLSLSNNQLTGPIPPELGNLRELTTLELSDNQLTGGPTPGESLDSWRARLQQQQQTTTGSGQEEKAPVPRAPELRVPREGGGAVSSGPAPSPPEDGDAARLFQEQVSSSAGLDALTRGNPGALEEVQRAINANARLSPAAALGGTENRRELARLVTMAADLGEVVVRHTQNKDATQKELALQPFAQAYYTAVKTGICNAYLAASVVSSSWVCTSKTGRMGKMGKFVKGLSSVPVVGVLAGPMGTALKAGDGYVQTRRLEKISGLAPDAVECCSLARKLGLRLTDGLPDDAMSMIDEAEEVGVQATAGVGGGAGVSGSSPHSGVSPDDLSEEEDLFDYVVEEVAGYEPTDNGGRKLGKRHLRKLLKAVRRDCLKGMKTTEQKVDKLLQVIFGEANMCPAATSSVPEDPHVQPPVVGPSHDAGVDRDAMATMREHLESLELANAEQQATLQELELGKAEQETEIKKLRGKVTTMDKRIPKPRVESDGSVDNGGQLLKQKQKTKTKTKDEFWQDAKNSASATDDRRTLNPDEHQAETRNTQAHVDEVDNRVDVLEAQFAALREQLRGKKKGR